MRKTKVLVAGASGMMGQKILAALAKKPNTTVLGLVRKREGDKLDSLEKLGVSFVLGDLSDKSSLLKATKDVDVVVSAVNGGPDVAVAGQLNLLAAAKENRVRKFIPSDYSLNFFNLKPGEHAFLDFRLQVAKALHASGLEYAHVLNGCFTDVFFGFLGAYDGPNQTLTYWGNGEQKFELTTTDDTASYTAEAALDPNAKGLFPVAGDSVSMKDVADIYHEVRGKKLKLVSKGTTEELRKWIEQTKASNPTNVFASIRQQYLLPMVDGRGKLDNLVNRKYPHIKPLSLKEWLKANPQV